MKRSRSRKFKIIAAAVIVMLLLLYAAAGNIIVSATLVPSFMTKLDFFDQVVDASYAEMIYTDDITENTRAARADVKAWLEEVKPEYYGQRSSDGYLLVASVIRHPDDEKRPWVMLLHGYTGWKEECYHYALYYYRWGFNVICPDMRCQGQSEGDFIGMGYTDARDNLLWLNYILRDDPEAEIALHGESMGASCALMMAGLEELPGNVRCIVSDCAYTDVPAIFRIKLKDWTGLPDLGFTEAARLALLARGGYDIRKASALRSEAQSSIPSLFIHGAEDKFIPIEMSRRLYEACKAPKECLWMEAAGHAQSAYKDPELYYGTIREFVEKYIELPAE